ncbi:MAG: hypothetical protein ACRDP3_22800 [Streptomyces sp.]|uniref:hypothetical protein n=1 Tax=Streptomyces sp. TaxID=1931 RepID=UPI003D6C6B5F
MEPRIQYVPASDRVRSLARTSPGVRVEDRGEQSLKGVGEPVRVWGGARRGGVMEGWRLMLSAAAEDRLQVG